MSTVGNLDLSCSIPATGKCATYDLWVDRAGAGDHLFVPAPHEADPVAAGRYRSTTVITVVLLLNLRTAADLGDCRRHCRLQFASVPSTLDTLRLLLPVSLTLAAVGLLESLLTAQVVDDMAGTPSSKNRECVGQGIANMTSALFGEMAGCAMIGQSMVNVSSGGRARLSTLTVGLVLMILIEFAPRLLAIVPVAALTAIMITVAINTFSWRSILHLRSDPASSSVVTLATVAIVVVTGNWWRAFWLVRCSAAYFCRPGVAGQRIDVLRLWKVDLDADLLDPFEPIVIASMLPVSATAWASVLSCVALDVAMDTMAATHLEDR